MTTLTKIRLDGVEYDLGGGSFTQEQADWAETDTTDVSFIKNKPTLASVATSGLYSDLTGTPSLGSLASKSSITHTEVSDWSTATASFLTSHQDLNGWLPQAVAKANIDLNTIIEQGVYNVSTSSANSSAHHYPVGVNGIMIVLRTNATSGQGFVQQYFRRTGTAGTNDHHMYVRECGSGGTGTWGVWVQVMTSKNLSTNGGTIATTSYVDDAIAAITDADNTAY